MSSDNFNVLLQSFIERRPFYAFTVELHGKRRLEIDHADALILSEGIAMFTASGKIPIWFDHESVNFIIDAPASDVPDGPHQ